ncbi:MAG: hypothetical protein J6Y01_03495, partial [Spirochaetales bacterium]|nr:hypothetical protein [Spirochaetales bacterium]
MCSVNFEFNIDEASLFNKKNMAIIVRSDRDRKRLAKNHSANILKNNIKLITLEDIKENVFLPADNCRVIAEDKRVFAFYRTLHDYGPKKNPTGEKSYINDWMTELQITGYKNALRTAQQFYALFEEINSSMITLEEVQKVISDNDKQKTNFAILIEIYNALQEMLKNIGLTDIIFYHNKQSIDSNISNINMMFECYNNIILLDCCGATSLDGYLIQKVEDELKKDNNKTIFNKLTIPNSIFDTDKRIFKTDSINIAELSCFNKETQISLVKASSPTEVYYKALSIVAGDWTHTNIIDLDIVSSYKYILSCQCCLQQSMPYFNCKLYVWLDTMFKLLDNIVLLGKPGSQSSLFVTDINVFRDA